jgi:hypothetical protein
MNVLEAAIILGVSKDSTDQDLRKSWRKLAMKYHPDVALGDKDVAVANFHRIQSAFQVLTSGGMDMLRSGMVMPMGANSRRSRSRSYNRTMIAGPSPRVRTPVNPMYWEEQAWLESQFGHLGSWGRGGTRKF